MTVTKSTFATADHGTDSECTEVESYTVRLDRDMEWAMDEGDRFFQGASEAHKSLRKIALRLAELGIDYNLTSHIELKLALGTSDSTRIRDLGDVVEMIKGLDLPVELADKLNPFLREKYMQLWDSAHPPGKRYLMLWSIERYLVDAKSLEELIAAVEAAANALRAMQTDGVTIDVKGCTTADWVYLVTTDPAIAKKYDMHDECEFA